ncbi:hypothetical protein PGLA_08250 [Paenibacillus glacialis]|uniref:Methyltransferase domain-containing protein n=1 Tax=Paenibacillus glacialis TaxID=494026 RepID=A0A168LRR6_9BACL|nr:hypothetical protein PGLA_08250 [Paenibacillus glacialis]
MTLLTKLIEQSGNPKGIVGSIMISIMNVAHAGMRNWALKKIHIRIDDTILDIGCGGGQTLHTLSRLNEQVKLYGIDYSKKSVEDSIRKNKHDVMTGKLSRI